MENNNKSKEDILRNALSTIEKDLRRPLSTISGMSDLIQENISDDETKEKVRIIQESAAEINQILNNVKHVLMQDNLRKELVLKPIVRKDLVKKLEQAISYSDLSNEVRLKLDVKIPSAFETDAEMLTQALLPLIKTTESIGKGDVTLYLKITQETAHWCYVKVGINKEKIADEPLFENKFDEILREKINHLLVVDSLEAFNTKLLINESDDHFEISFFIKLHFSKVLPDQRQSSTIPETFRSNAQILIVEDNELNQLVTKLMVESFGCAVDLVKNGKEAIEKFNPEIHKCVFMDIEMPIMNGIDATRILREKYGERIPIIGLSADAMGGDVKKHEALGFSDYLIKPVKKETLGQKIYHWTKQTQS